MTYDMLHGFELCKHADLMDPAAAVGLLPGTQAGMSVLGPQRHAVLGKN